MGRGRESYLHDERILPVRPQIFRNMKTDMIQKWEDHKSKDSIL